jgi:hypothetical protein
VQHRSHAQRVDSFLAVSKFPTFDCNFINIDSQFLHHFASGSGGTSHHLFSALTVEPCTYCCDSAGLYRAFPMTADGPPDRRVSWRRP